MVGVIKLGVKVIVNIWCKGSVCDVSVIVVELEVDKFKQVEEKKVKFDNIFNFLGLVVSDLSDVQKKELKVENGVLVENVSGVVVVVGICLGDVIQCFNEVDVNDSKQFGQLVVKFDVKKWVVVLVCWGDFLQFVLLCLNGGN